jgi:hypothetical protein
MCWQRDSRARRSVILLKSDLIPVIEKLTIEWESWLKCTAAGVDFLRRITDR